jgi:hypothetical protein
LILIVAMSASMDQCLEPGDLRCHREAIRHHVLLTAVFFPLAIGSVLLGVAQVFARMGIQRRWRAWLTNSVVSRWLTNGRYYQLNLVSGDHQNPEYRIAEDLRIATDSPVDFIAGVTSAFLSAATFIVVLLNGHRRRTYRDDRRVVRDHPRFPGDRRRCSRRDRLGFDQDHRTPLRAGLRGQEPERRPNIAIR